MAPRKKYIAYDYEAAYQSQLKQMDEQVVADLIRKGAKYAYAAKRIDAGDQVELEIYPDFLRREMPTEIRRTGRGTGKAQKNLKDRHARKYCERLINANFTSNDIWITLTYTNRNLPRSMEEAQVNMQRYIKRLNYRRKKQGLSLCRYVYVTEWEERGGGKVRCHHHAVMDGELPMDEVEAAWKLGKRNETRRLDYDENGLSGLANYITKDPKGKKRWCASKNLKKPVEHKNHYQFGRSKITKMAADYENAEKLVRKAAPDCWLKTVERRWNEVNGLLYVYARLRRKCAPGDTVYVRDGEDMGIESNALFELMEYTDSNNAIIRRRDGKGKLQKVPLDWLHLVHRKGRKKQCKSEVRQRNSRL